MASTIISTKRLANSGWTFVEREVLAIFLNKTLSSSLILVLKVSKNSRAAFLANSKPLGNEKYIYLFVIYLI